MAIDRKWPFIRTIDWDNDQSNLNINNKVNGFFFFFFFLLYAISIKSIQVHCSFHLKFVACSIFIRCSLWSRLFLTKMNLSEMNEHYEQERRAHIDLGGGPSHICITALDPIKYRHVLLRICILMCLIFYSLFFRVVE